MTTDHDEAAAAATPALLAEADLLYSLLPSDFTARRNQRAKELAADAQELAAGVRALRRPSAAAWALNLLVRREREQVEQVLAVAVALREAQSGLDGDQLRQLTRQRRQLVAAVAIRAAQLSAEEGAPISAAVIEQVETALTAAVVDEQAAEALRSGLLVSAPRASGLEPVDLAGVLAHPSALGHQAPIVAGSAGTGRPGLRVVPDPDTGARARRAAQRDLAEAQRRVVRANGALGRAQRQMAMVQAEVLGVQARLDEARRKVAALEAEAEAVDNRLGEAEDLCQLLGLDHDEAETLRAAAQARLDSLR